ncbi:MAG: hypothetical protein EOM20_06975 [Spartobacteria bacterium]|nr:hypothetical protein [Spartobacteria bacterium]
MKSENKSICEVAGRSYKINGQDTFLYSGEMHYFRIPQRYWGRHLDALKQAGCNGVSTYVPWSWHEFEERNIDLSGQTHPERNLQAFLDLVAEKELFVSIKPGPYIMAETTDQGIPRWITENYPETACRRLDGTPWGPDYVIHSSPVFRAKAAYWLDHFARNIVVPRQHKEKGGIIQMQLCNEIGIFQWLGSQGDYSPVNVASWHAYLEQRFATPEALEQRLDRKVTSFRSVAPPSGACANRREYVLYNLWHDYHRWLYGDYVKFISTTLRNAGVQTPMFANIGGWVFGRAHEFPLNATFHRETTRLAPEVFFGIDHIPEFVSSLNAHDGILATQITDELQDRKRPLYSAELQCGSREHGVQPYPGELAQFYRQCIIHGLTGMNFYMFSQGRNIKGRGIDGPTFYWYTAVDFKGKPMEVYPVVQELGEWLKDNSAPLLQTSKAADMALGYYPPMYESEFLYPKLQHEKRVDLEAIGINDPVSFRDKAYFDGAARILVKLNVPFDLADLTRRTIKELRAYRSLVILSNEIMDAATQEKLAAYVKAGGRLVVFPRLPQYDANFEPCTILQDALGIRMGGPAVSKRVYMDTLKDIPAVPTISTIEAKGATVLARTAEKEIVGVEKKVGKGVVRCFGFECYYTIEEHPQILGAMMETGKANKPAWTDNNVLQVQARFNESEGFLFVGNVHRATATSSVSVRHPRHKEDIAIGPVELPALAGLILPVHVALSNDITLLYATTELIDRPVGDSAAFTVRGLPHTNARLAFRAKKALDHLLVDGESIALTEKDGLYVCEIPQTGGKQSIEVC